MNTFSVWGKRHAQESKGQKEETMPENQNIKIHLRITVKRNHIIGEKKIYQQFIWGFI